METSIPSTKYNAVKPNWAFFLYFSVMFVLYTHTYIQLGIQLFIIAYVILTKFFSGKIILRKSTIRNAVFICLWFGLFTLLLFLSTKFWAYSTMMGSKTMLGVFRCFAIGLAIFIYADTSERALSVMQSFALAAAIMGIAAMVTTPASQYFQAGDEGFGTAIGQQRNLVGAVSTYMIFTCYFLKKYTNFQYGYLLMTFFLILSIVTGSRSSLIQLILLLVMFIVFDRNYFRMLTKLLAVVLVGTIAVILLKNIPILYENIWLRFEAMFTTMSGNEIEDTSTLGRQYYREIAFEMLKKRPLLGWGLDGFYCYLRDNPIYKGYYIDAVYSHCSWSEIMSSLGIVGLLVWYIPNLYVLGSNMKHFYSHPLLKYSLFLLISLLIMDYARLPWMSHPGCYQFFVLFAVIINLARDSNYYRKQYLQMKTQNKKYLN
ncbi:MAG: O-antigen ligase family protein [Clostridium sp.]|nr:O-antigen ligase family protein [Clostridium sp.]